MEIKYSVETEDLVAFAGHQRQLHHRDDGATKFFWWLMVPALIASVSIFAEANFFRVGAVFAVFVIAYSIWVKVYMRRYYKACYSEESARGIVGNHRLILEPDYFIEVADLRETVCRWEHVAGVYHTTNHTFIYLNSILAYVVPRRAFGSEAEFQEFRKKLEEYAARTHATGSDPAARANASAE